MAYDIFVFRKAQPASYACLLRPSSTKTRQAFGVKIAVLYGGGGVTFLSSPPGGMPPTPAGESKKSFRNLSRAIARPQHRYEKRTGLIEQSNGSCGSDASEKQKVGSRCPSDVTAEEGKQHLRHYPACSTYASAAWAVRVS